MIFVHEFESLNQRITRPSLCRNWLRLRLCLRWMTIGLTTLLVPQGKCVCVSSMVFGTGGLVAMTLCSFLDTHMHSHKQRPSSMLWCTQYYDSYNPKRAQWVAMFQIICHLCLEKQTKQFLWSEINPYASPGPNMISPIWDTISVALRIQTRLRSVEATGLIHLFNTINFRVSW